MITLELETPDRARPLPKTAPDKSVAAVGWSMVGFDKLKVQ